MDRAAGFLEAIVASNAIAALGPCGALLADAVKGAFAKKPAQLTSVANIIGQALPGDLALAPKDQWGRPRVACVDAAFVADFAGAVDRIDGALAKRTAAHILMWPRHFDPDAVLVPAIKRLLAAKRKGGSAFEALHTAAIAHLTARISLPLEAPTNWVRPSRIGCQCTHCAELSRFLADANSATWPLRAAERFRGHVEDEIRRASADVDTRTERRGSPHQLICTKNQASYERRVLERKRDLADLKTLKG